MSVPILWRTKRQRYSLQSEVCHSCERAVFPPRELCPYCHAEMAEVAPPSASQCESNMFGFQFVLPKTEMAPAAGDD